MALSEQDKVTRRQGIAATDAAPIVRLSPWKSPAEVWLEKKRPEMVPDKKSKGIEWGVKLEPLIAEEYALKTGQVLDRSPIIHNKRLPWLMCSPDRLIQGKKKGLECKTASGMYAHEWGPAGTDRVPPQYLVQVAHSMMVLDCGEWDLAALIGGSDFRIYHLYRDMELMRALFAQEEEFYKRFILGNETPQFDWGDGLTNLVKHRYPTAKDGEEYSVDKNGDAEIKRALDSLIKARNTQKDYEKIEDKEKLLVQAYMKDAEALLWTEKNLKITWRNIRESVSVDWLAIFQEIHPHLTLSAEEKKQVVLRHLEVNPGARRFVVYDRSGKKKKGQAQENEE